MYDTVDFDCRKVINALVTGWGSGNRNSILTVVPNGPYQLMLGTANKNSCTVAIYYYE